MSKYIFKCIDEETYSTVKGKEVVVEFSGDLNRDQILEEFKGFLQAAGFVFNIDDRLDVVNDTEDYEGLFDEDPEASDEPLNENQLNFDDYINIPYPHHLDTTGTPSLTFGATMNAGTYDYTAATAAAVAPYGSFTTGNLTTTLSYKDINPVSLPTATLDLGESTHITLNLTDSFETKDKLG
jgi:hypothetical protein